ncbi:lasso RiPP family leader peptide-containing protein [Streptomyces sp. NPDC059816]|uniref:lasso RiPP family leader peptide-containing protein n=1 Tax=unclassified Streptomyces TaxID=2593676 RepID=UPI00365DBBBC
MLFSDTTEEATTVYEPPMLAEAGDFAAVTMGLPNWGNDFRYTCWIMGCGE